MVKKGLSTTVLGTVGVITTHSLIAPIMAQANEIMILGELDFADLTLFSSAHVSTYSANAVLFEAVSYPNEAIAEDAISSETIHTTAIPSNPSPKGMPTSGTLISDWMDLSLDFVPDADDEKFSSPLSQSSFLETLNFLEVKGDDTDKPVASDSGESDDAVTLPLAAPPGSQPTPLSSSEPPVASDAPQSIESPAVTNAVDESGVAATTSSDATYVVQPGDTLEAIARQQGISVQALVAINRIDNPDLIYVGTNLRLPTLEAEQSNYENSTLSITPQSPNLTTTDSQRQAVSTDSVSVPSSSLVSNSGPAVPSWAHRQVEPNVPLVPSVQTGSQGLNTYVWPARGTLSSGYGWRWGRMHRGVDIAAPTGTPVYAAAAGTVSFAGWNNGGYGNLVDIRHSDGSLTRYAHNNRLLVTLGQPVEQGQLIAEVGSTGYSTGPHLHFEIHKPNQGAVNPMSYLTRSTTIPNSVPSSVINASAGDEPDKGPFSEGSLQRYKIATGDTLTQISKAFDLTVEDLATINGIANPDLIFAGADLLIPQNQVQEDDQTQTASDSTASRSLPHGQQDSTPFAYALSVELDRAAVASWQNRQVVKGAPLQPGLKVVSQPVLQKLFAFIWPTDGTLLSGYGWRRLQAARKFDIAAPVGTPVVATADGLVVSADWNDDGYGNLIEIHHPDGSTSRYAHNSQLFVKPGQCVRQGQNIAAVGNTGYSPESKLRFEIHHTIQ
ncbi:MAG: peptidoglycan DD-metalloendopeptidase family protein [Cyanobacteria bacterium P01_F01_bin.56]